MTARAARALLPLVLVAGLTGCSAEAPPPPAGPPAAEQRVGLTEWEIVTEARPLSVGAVRLVVTNAGAAPHDLAVRVDGDQRAVTPVLDPGEVHELGFTVAADERVELWCTVTGHHAAGMHTVLDVVTPEAGP
ncbi:hypothetical protein E9529_03430 [Blastococcus sp. KM273128]|uniref:hypothetical protein n=1 Tax=Blastococcus sp. KM273128 TaxID=2570314 RepID=UPI001F333652|nr:hypothetical protein [Blastococcus sp. KM273128]MCF6743336.1 hypothetical protein [Blastococcus sp. KM273128]